MQHVSACSTRLADREPGAGEDQDIHGAISESLRPPETLEVLKNLGSRTSLFSSRLGSRGANLQ